MMSVVLPGPDWSRVFFAPDAYRWQELDLEGDGDSPVTIHLEAVVSGTVRFRLARPDGTPVRDHDVFVQVPFGALALRGGVVVGTTDSSGTDDRLPTPVLISDGLRRALRSALVRISAGSFRRGRSGRRWTCGWREPDAVDTVVYGRTPGGLCRASDDGLYVQSKCSAAYYQLLPGRP